MPKSKGTEKEIHEAMLLAEKVKKLRIENGLTQADVAEKLNVTPGFISNVENIFNNAKGIRSFDMLNFYNVKGMKF